MYYQISHLIQAIIYSYSLTYGVLFLWIRAPNKLPLPLIR